MQVRNHAKGHFYWRQLSRRKLPSFIIFEAIVRGQIIGAINRKSIIQVNFPGAIVRWTNNPGENHPGENCHGGIILGVNYPRGNNPMDNHLGSNCPGDNFFRGQFSGYSLEHCLILALRKTIFILSASLTILTGKNCVWFLIEYRNGWLAASYLFYMFTQSIKFYTFYHHVLRVIVWKMWFIK